jgi:hypothetical protein
VLHDARRLGATFPDPEISDHADAIGARLLAFQYRDHRGMNAPGSVFLSCCVSPDCGLED